MTEGREAVDAARVLLDKRLKVGPDLFVETRVLNLMNNWVQVHML